MWLVHWENQKYTRIWCILQELGILLWRVSGSEELVETLNLEEYLNLRMEKQVEQKLNRRGKHTITGN